MGAMGASATASVTRISMIVPSARVTVRVSSVEKGLRLMSSQSATVSPSSPYTGDSFKRLSSVKRTAEPVRSASMFSHSSSALSSTSLSPRMLRRWVAPSASVYSKSTV